MTACKPKMIVPAMRRDKSSYALLALVILQSMVMLGAAVVRQGQTDQKSFDTAAIVAGL